MVIRFAFAISCLGRRSALADVALSLLNDELWENGGNA
jgi:hypothetical protein